MGYSLAAPSCQSGVECCINVTSACAPTHTNTLCLCLCPWCYVSSRSPLNAACDDVWIMWRSRRLPHFVCTRLAVGDGCDVAALSRPLWSDTPLLKCMTLLVDPSPVALPKVDLFHCYMLSTRLWLSVSPLLPVEQPHLEKYPKKLSKSTENRIVSLLFTTFGKKKQNKTQQQLTNKNKMTMRDFEGGVYSGRDLN